MRRLVITPDARADVRAALTESRRQFGPLARARYRLLVETAYRDLLSNPTRPGVTSLPDIPADIRLYPIRYSRTRVPLENRVGDPRHIVAFRFDDTRVEVVRLLHDAMDLPGRLG